MTVLQFYFSTLLTFYAVLFIIVLVADEKRRKAEKRRLKQRHLKCHENFMKWLDIVWGK